MFGYVIDLSRLSDWAERTLDANWRRCAGLAFMALAIVAIQYDEIIAPSMERVSDAWTAMAGDVGRKLANLNA